MESNQKAFFQVFPELDVNKSLFDLFASIFVEEINYHKKDNILEINVKSMEVVSYQVIKTMKDAIKKQLFASSELNIKINIIFDLSSNYSLQEILKNYKESIVQELMDKKLLYYLIVKNANWEVSGDTITVQLENNLIARKNSSFIHSFIENIFSKQFNRKIQLNIEYIESSSNKIITDNDSLLKNEVITLMKDKATTDTTKVAKTVKATDSCEYKKEFSEKTRKKAKDPDVFYGRECDGDITPIEEIIDEIGEVVIAGQLISIDMREIRMEKTIMMLDITDFMDTITIKLFVKNEELGELLDNLKKNQFYRLKGTAMMDKYDKEITIGSIKGIKAIPDFTKKRYDNHEEKRVELHLHTVMSDMDSVVDIKKVIQRAKDWGMTSIAITDHGCLQAFPIANHCISKNDPFKIIYGVEAYFVDDAKQIVTNSCNQPVESTYVVFDIETTGFSAHKNKIIEIGAVKMYQNEVVETFNTFVNPQIPIPYKIQQLTGIVDDDVQNAKTIEEVLPDFLAFCKDSILVAHNADFDMAFIEANATNMGLECKFTTIDTVSLARVLMPSLHNFRLKTLAKKLGIALDNHHRAVDDAKATSDIFKVFLEKLDEQGVTTLDEINALTKRSAEYIKKLPTYHGIILVQNEIGRINLNKLVSHSHLDYFHRRPRMPKSLINELREGLIIGAACEAGEVFQAILHEKQDDVISQLMQFYDYLEIQPVGNNDFMLRSDKFAATTKEELIEYNRQIVALGETYDKPVVATCDVHFIDPEDEQYRRIIMAGKGFKDADQQPPLYFRTTQEMLDEFEYLGTDKAYEVVITNTNLIADKIEKISPVLPNKCPPEIPNSDATLRKICYEKAHEIYGPSLHEVVVERLERELHSIISNGFAVMYIISQKLVWDSNANGYLVGSRGSVGSSFAATMSGITEVNPLAPHYICPKCYYTDFDSPEVKAYSGSSGCDMPDALCPKCQNPLLKEGHDIPFETFLGFEGDKEPDIDLNFSGDYQSKAHQYVEVIFGEGKAYRAGTIGTMAEKTALAYVYKYYEERNVHKRRCEMRRIASGCTGVKRTTGQHPGGIIVVPHDRDIYEFTAIQHPANDMTTPIITTHFEYHSIDHNLLKLDILGHDDPTIIRRLEDITGISSQTIKLDDKDVMSLFHSTDRLGIKPSDINGIPLGCLGVPEFGTDFVIQMLVDAKPQSFSDLVRISGLSHGTDVWLGNAQTLIEEGKGTISTVICTRDDIMTYLINQGIDKGLSFSIMESVRKGKGLKPEWEKAMIEHDVPEWYIWSCKKIKYMFPKAHAAAYVMMAWRIAWYKVFYPLAYYTAYLSIRASAFSYELMCFGKETLEHHLKELTMRGKENLTAKELDVIKDMRIVQEMYARGFEFKPIDLTCAHDKNFQIIDGKIMPSLSAIDGLGEKAAEALMQAVKDGPFISKDDFRARTKVSKTVTDKMSSFGILGNLPESNQLDLDFFM
ncbi:MAG: PolC-type DNA polymerase III [Cellulosilyticaceae bacterium]